MDWRLGSGGGPGNGGVWPPLENGRTSRRCHWVSPHSDRGRKRRDVSGAGLVAGTEQRRDRPFARRRGRVGRTDVDREPAGPGATGKISKPCHPRHQVWIFWPAGSLALWLWKLGVLEEMPEGLPAPYQDMFDGRIEAAAGFWASRKVPYEAALALMSGDLPQRLQSLDLLDSLGASSVAAKLRLDLRADGIALPRGKGKTTRSSFLIAADCRDPCCGCPRQVACL